jgi:hypothetical protein
MPERKWLCSEGTMEDAAGGKASKLGQKGEASSKSGSGKQEPAKAVPFGEIDQKASARTEKEEIKANAKKFKEPLHKIIEGPMKHEEERSSGGMELTPAADEADKENVAEKAVPKTEPRIKFEKRPNLKKVKSENVSSPKGLRPRRAFKCYSECRLSFKQEQKEVLEALVKSEEEEKQKCEAAKVNSSKIPKLKNVVQPKSEIIS